MKHKRTAKSNIPSQRVFGNKFADWQQNEYEGMLREVQSQNDFMSFHGVPRSEGANKEVIKTRWVLKPQGEGVTARFVMKHFNTWKDENNDFYAGTPTPVSFNLVWAVAAKRIALGKSRTFACLDVSTADTLRMIREENLPNFQPFDDESFYKVDKALNGYRGSPRYRMDAVAGAAKDLGINPSKIDNSLYLDPGNFIQYVHVADELLSGDDQRWKSYPVVRDG